MTYPVPLIVAARSEPMLLIVDLTSGRLTSNAVPDAVTLQALARLIPGVRVLLFGRLGRRNAGQLHGARVVDGVTNLLALVQELTSR